MILRRIKGASGAIHFAGVLLCAAIFGFSAGAANAQTPFYQASESQVRGEPGTIIRSEPMMFAPAGAQAYRVLYRSSGMHDEPIAVSGVIVIRPARLRPPAGRSSHGRIRRRASSRTARLRLPYSSSSRWPACAS